MSRQEIIELFIVRAAPAAQQELRQQLERLTLDQLKTAYEALQAQVRLQATEEELLRVRAEADADRVLHQYHMHKAREPQRTAEAQARLARDRQTFADAAKTLRSFGMVEANFHLICRTLGENFSVYQIREMIAANGATLSPPTQEELDEWTRQDVEAHNLRLLSMDIPTLRKLAREAGANGAAPVAPDETQRVRQAERADVSYSPLPDEFRDGDGPEEVLNAVFIKKCSKETLRILIKRYGSDQVNEALRTRIDGIYQY